MKTFHNQKKAHAEHSENFLAEGQAEKQREAQARTREQADAFKKSEAELEKCELEWQEKSDKQESEEAELRNQLDACMERDVQAMMERKRNIDEMKAQIHTLTATIKEATGLLARSMKPMSLVRILSCILSSSLFLTVGTFFSPMVRWLRLARRTTSLLESFKDLSTLYARNALLLLE